MRRIFLVLASVISLGLVAVPVASSAVFAANPIEQGVNATCEGDNCTKKDAQGNPVSAEKSVKNLVADIINIFSWIVGVVSVIMIIFGGFKYITSGGDAGKVTSAKNTIVYALVGLVIVALAQVIVLFVLGNVT